MTETQNGQEAYLRQTHRPLVCLVFLLPWVILYEVGTLLVASDASQNRVVAYLLLERFFRVFGASTLYLPGLALVAIFLVGHVASRDRWSVRWRTLGGMFAESIVLALPMLAFNQVLASRPARETLNIWLEDLVLAVGAGIYEELVFRLICITLLSMVMIDMLKIRRAWALVLMIAISSLFFAAHHYPPLGRDPFHWVTFLFRSVAGAYLATVYVARGFGIAAGCHVMYDIIVVTWTVLRA